jgi:hypothetical protein
MITKREQWVVNDRDILVGTAASDLAAFHGGDGPEEVANGAGWIGDIDD